ncbi:ABC-type transport system involved in multi-copper enzyme maturation, permease component [Paenibacillus sophorae]|uniref:ABC transporter permease n=1 Tax=Paenibacillus sophorae TaxID=1333845 RepID=A0A1H8ULW9_9BACL|nr:ABC transporter permease subunit [Paenibacillus sophorae]QWU13292.1 ABC transporter permease [Paenibacillus sophorae]SEP03963.1 ABC-type transport system involved in multi-copper enzyme maturation, permease component [Paenibacillus sophorae]
MDTLTRFELRKIMRRKSFYAGIAILVVVVILMISTLVTAADITGKDGKELKGLAAIPLRKEYDRQLAGPLTVERVADAVERHQKVMRDPKNLNEKGEITNEAYIKYEVKDEQMDRLIRFTFSHVHDYDHYIIDRMTPSAAKAFYQKRMENVNEYLNTENSDGYYSPEDKAFLLKMNERIPVPFQMDYITGWENVFENLQFVFLFTAFVIAICLAPVFAGEYQSGADSIILSSRYGRNKIIAAKLIASFLVSLGLVVFALMTYTLVMLGIYGFTGGSASVQMIKLLAPVPYTVFQTYLWAVFIGGLACLLVGAVTLWLSSRIRSPFPVIIAIVMFLFGPLFFSASKSNRLFNHLMDLLPGNMFDSFEKVTGYEVFHIFGQLIPEYKVMVGFAIIVIALLVPLTYRAFNKHQVI